MEPQNWGAVISQLVGPPSSKDVRSEAIKITDVAFLLPSGNLNIAPLSKTTQALTPVLHATLSSAFT